MRKTSIIFAILGILVIVLLSLMFHAFFTTGEKIFSLGFITIGVAVVGIIVSIFENRIDGKKIE